MQRRAAALWVVFFLVIGAASYSLVATAEEPDLSVQGETLSENDTFTVDGQEYTVSSVGTETRGGGGHGGGGKETVHTATISWTVEDGTYTETWDNDSVVTFDGEEWRVVVDSGEDPSSFTLREQINRTAILRDDPDADNETVTHQGEEHVVVREDGEEKLVPADDYFPEPETREYSEGDTVDYRGNETTFADVATDGVTLEWTAPKSQETTVSEQDNVTLNGQTHFAHFPDSGTLVLSQDFDALSDWRNEVDTHHTHENGLWGVTIVSFSGAALLLILAFIPSRY